MHSPKAYFSSPFNSSINVLNLFTSTQILEQDEIEAKIRADGFGDALSHQRPVTDDTSGGATSKVRKCQQHLH